MSHASKTLFILALGGAVLSAASARATDGYFSHGYGTQAKGLGGAAIAYPKDTLAIASNPASATLLGDRFDLDVDYFQPTRSASISGNGFGPNQSFGGNARDSFVIPELGYIRKLGARWALGLAIYGNGGMNTSYSVNPYGRFGASGATGVDLQQLFVAPTLAYRFAEGHSVGLSLNIADQFFTARGIGAFGGFSTAPGSVSDRGKDSALGIGARIGWLGQVTPWLSLGASWQSKTYSQEFSRYKGLFAGQGSFDIPANWGVGAAIKASPDLDFALDIKRIHYSDVPAIGNDFQRLFSGAALGASNGPGFGWKDTTSVKLGVNYRLSPAWQIRAGYDYTTKVVPAAQTFLNILAPGVIQHQVTVGATWALSERIELSAFGLYGLPKTVKGSGSIPAGFPPAGFGGGEANVKLSELSVGLGLGWHF